MTNERSHNRNHPSEIVKRRLFRLRRNRKGDESIDDMHLHRSESPAPAGGRRRANSADPYRRKHHENPNSDDDEEENDHKSHEGSRRSHGSSNRLGQFMSRRKQRRQQRQQRQANSERVVEAGPGYGSDDGGSGNHSVDQSVDYNDHYDNGFDTHQPERTPYKTSESSSRLINDPTHMPYQPGMTFDNTPPSPTPSGGASAEQLYPEQYEEQQQLLSANHSAAPPPRRNLQRARYSVYSGNSKRKFRVRPYRCFPDHRTMTEEEIYQDSLKPSVDVCFLQSFVASNFKTMKRMKVSNAVAKLYGAPTKDGRIGSLRAEVLGCVSLNRTKPDVAVYMVCGDTAFSSDVITGYRSPMWPCEARRAAVFPVHHAYSQLFVGVFDASKSKESDSFCGRVVLDLAALRSDTEYDVTLPLRSSSFVYDRRKRGVIRLRFSLHWFSERAAALSYFKPVRGLSKSIPFYEGQPTIPCADPKTFQNVAVTVYGQDMPGKYTRNAFKATMREFNLYQQNIKLLLQVMALDAVLYHKLHISLYLFFGSMYCVMFRCVSLVPPLFVGYLLLLFMENYKHYVEHERYNLGYKSVTIQEVVRALINKPTSKGAWLQPLLMEKKVKKKHGYQTPEELQNADNEVEIDPLDHREFPFSERDSYPKLAVEDSLAPGSNTKAPPESDEEEGHGDDDSEDSVGRDDEVLMGGNDAMFGLDFDEGDDDDGEEGIPNAHTQRRGSLLQNKEKRIVMGPPQDVTIKGRKVPPQVQLQKVEKRVHKFSNKVSVEMVAPPIETSREATEDATERDVKLLQDEAEALKKRKAVYDEFDKLLRMQTRTANPVVRIMSSFLGPLMRIARVFIFLFRISFHVTTWKDPFLSFWVFLFLCSWCLVLLLFPWRSFFLVVVSLSLGPQNIVVRKYLEKRAADKAMEDESESSNRPEPWSQSVSKSTGNHQSSDYSVDSAHKSHERTRLWPFGGGPKEKQKHSHHQNHHDGYHHDTGHSLKIDRPAFRAEHHVATSKQPRAVVIPYSRFKKDRFYDWPPDPTVSKATPMPFREYVPPQRTLPPDPTPIQSDAASHDGSEDRKVSTLSRDGADLPRGLRKRHQNQNGRGRPASRDLFR